MANQVTTTTFDDAFYSAVEQQILLFAGADSFGGIEPLIDRRTLPPNSLSISQAVLATMTISARGQGSQFANAAATTGSGGTTTAAAYGARFAFDKVAVRSAGQNLIQVVATGATANIKQKRENTICALFSSINSTVGSTGTSLTLANWLTAQYKIKNAGFLNQAPVAVIDPIQEKQLKALMIASTGTVETAMGQSLFFDQQLQQAAGSLYGTNIWLSNEVPDDAADFDGAMFVPANPMGGWAALADLWTIETEVWKQDGEDNLIVDTCFGVAEQRGTAAVELKSGITA